jgi:hypothetical protein
MFCPKAKSNSKQFSGLEEEEKIPQGSRIEIPYDESFLDKEQTAQREKLMASIMASFCVGTRALLRTKSWSDPKVLSKSLQWRVVNLLHVCLDWLIK